MYYVLATELSSMLKAKDEDEDEEDDQAVKRKDTPRVSSSSAGPVLPPKLPAGLMLTHVRCQGPGMAMTYIYEPTRAGGVKEAGSIPVKAPSNRLLTSTDGRFAN